jgi:hypothetical protein
MVELKEDRISDSLFLLSRKNYWDAIKIAYDVLINETFKHGNGTGIRQIDLETKGKDTICLLYDFLKSKNVNNVDQLIPELHLLTIYFNNYSREAIKVNFSNNKIKVLTMNLVGLLEFLVSNTDSSNYHIGMIDSDLKGEVKSELTQELYKSTKQYFDILILSKEIANSNFWDDIEKYNPDNYNISVFSNEEFDHLVSYKNIIDEYQFSLDKIQRDEIEDLWGTYLDLEEIKRKIRTQYYIIMMYTVLDDFRKADKSSGKSGNAYKEEKEAAFHKNVYPYMVSQKYDLALSELNSGNQRYDILIYDSVSEMCSIIELKVNELKKVNSDIDQILNYLNEVEDKPHHYIEPPLIGVLMIYNIGSESLANTDLIAKATQYDSMTKITNNFYLLKEEEDRKYPLLIGLYNGEE